jgi:TatD DNase family protein
VHGPPDLVDIGANLADAAFRGDREVVIGRALAAGVRRMVLTGTSVAESGNALALAKSRPGVFWSTAGVHPHHAKLCDDATMPALRALLADPQVVAVGECGLDFYRDLSPRDVQERWFEAHVELAIELQKPLFVHDRDAFARTHAILKAHRARLPRAVVHCFTAGAAALRAWLDLDLHIGITGWICDERRGHHLRELVRLIPEDRLMLETDSPYLLPRTIRPPPPARRNEPAYLPFVLDAVAECLGRSRDAVAASTSSTAVEFFNLQ